MARGQLTRREFLIIGGTVAAGALATGGVAAVPAAALAPRGADTPRMAFKLSLRGRRGSIAGKNCTTPICCSRRPPRPTPTARIRATTRASCRSSSATTSSTACSPAATARSPICASCGGPALVGDCNRNRAVSIDELVLRREHRARPEAGQRVQAVRPCPGRPGQCKRADTRRPQRAHRDVTSGSLTLAAAQYWRTSLSSVCGSAGFWTKAAAPSRSAAPRPS